MEKLKTVLLVDDDHSTNFFHRLVLHNANIAEQIEVSINGEQALEYLQEALIEGNPLPEFIFLDINMPVMDGWEFLRAFDRLDNTVKRHCNIVILTTSINPDDREFALKQPNVKDFRNKPLTVEMLEELKAALLK
jgi:CheY-like chemotaxis protein